MYIRFVIDDIDEISQKRLGIFHAIRYLRDEGKLLPYEEEQMNQVMTWFSENLQKPSRLSKSTKRHSANKAITWFKDDAIECISKIREIISILESHGIKVDVVKTEKPGYIVYEDDHQVAAEPFNETET